MAANASGFSIVGRLHLVGPDNIRQITTKLHKDLSAVKGTIDLGLKPGLNAKLADLNSKLQTLRGNVNALSNTRGLGKVSQSFNTFSKAANNVSRANAGLVSSFSHSVKVIGIYSAAALALGATIGGVRSGMLEWQSEFVKIAQITGKTTGQLAGMKAEIHSLATGLGVSSRSLVSVSNTLAQAGLSARDTSTALKALASTKLAPTFGDINRTVEGSLSIMGAFGTGVDKLEGQLGSINSVAAKFAVESDDIVRAISRAGSTVHQAGASLEEFLALFTSVRSTTRLGAEQIANSFNTIFSRLQRPRTLESLEDKLGISLSSNGMGLGPLETIRRISEALKDIPDGSLFKASIAEEIGGIRQIGKTLPLLNQFAVTLDALRVAETGQASLATDVAKAQESLAVQLESVHQRFLQVFDTVADSSAFMGLAASLFSVAKGLAAVLENAAPLLPALTALGAIRLGGSLAKGIRGHAQGGFIAAGRGSSVDDVPAMLAKGEYVLNAAATNRIGKQNLDAVNFGNAKHFARGGSVGGGFSVAPAEGGLTSTMRELISVIRDEVLVTKQSIDAKRLEKGNIPLSDDAGYALARTPSRRSRAAAAMQFATALPLSRMSFDQSAAAVVSGRPDDFVARRSTYGLAPQLTFHEQALQAEHVPQARSRYFRRMTRAEREARIADLGGSQLLGTVRRNALAAQQQSYFDSIGYQAPPAQVGLGRRSLGSIASAARSTTSFLKPAPNFFGPIKGNLPALGFGVAALATSQPANQLATQIGGHRAAAGFQGVVGGALAGGTIGSLAGPVGTVAGAAIGGVAGLVTALDDFKRTVADQSIENGLKGISVAFTDFQSAVQKGSLEEARGRFHDVVNQQGQFEGANREAARTKSEAGLLEKTQSGLLGLGSYLGLGRYVDAYRAEMAGEQQKRETLEYHTNRQAQLSEVSPANEDFLSKILKSKKSFVDAQADADVRGIVGQKVALRVSQNAIARGGNISQQNEADLTARYSKEAWVEIMKTFKAVNGPLKQFQFALKASAEDVEAFATRLSDLDTVDQHLQFMTGNGPAPRLQSNLKFGSQFFGNSLGVLSRLSPEVAGLAPALNSANKTHNILSKNPDLLAGGASMMNALLKGGVNADFVQQFQDSLSEIKDPELSHHQRLAKALEPLSKNALSAVQDVAPAVNQHGDALLARHTHLEGLRNTARETSLDVAERRLDTHRLQASLNADRFGGRAADFMSLDQLQAPHLLRQQQLSGLSGKAALDPRAIADRITDLTRQERVARTAVANNPLGGAEVEKLATLTSALGNARQALVNLTDATRANTAIQEKLESLNGDKAGRQNAFERFAGSSRSERAQQEKDAMAFVKVKQSGKGLEHFDADTQSRTIRFLQNNRDVQLMGGMTGDQNLVDLRKKSFKGLFEQPGKLAKQRDDLNNQLLQNAGKAEQAAGLNANVAGMDVGAFASATKSFQSAIGTLIGPIDQFSQTVAKMPHEIAFVGNVKHEIVINGAEALARMSPELLKMIDQGAKAVVNSQLAKHFPDAGPFNS